MRYLEDFTPGQVIELGSRGISREEILAFARDFDPQPFHLDEAAARASHFGGLVASGWHTTAILMRLMVDGLLRDTASMGSPGVDQLRWERPVRPGDRLSARGTTLEVIPSQSRPDRGVVKSLYEVFNQDGERVMTLQGMGLFRRRPVAA